MYYKYIIYENCEKLNKTPVWFKSHKLFKLAPEVS